MADLGTPLGMLNAYESEGLKGYIDSPRDRSLFMESQKQPVYYEPNMAGSGEGKRALLWPYVIALDPLSFTEVQDTGDCSSHAARNARDGTRAVQICIQKKPEDFVVRGATEPTYGARGHSGQGMSPAVAAMFEKDVGFLVRKKYEGVVDLGKYTSRIGTNWGSTGVPENVKELCRQHRVGVIRQIAHVSDARDALANGYCLASGQFASWAAAPNSQDIHPRTSGGWSHSMATVGMDFTRKHWPFDVFFIQNSWGGWNQKPKNWPADYPPWVPGMIVTKADDWEVCVSGGDCYAYGSVDGFPPQKLPDYGTVGLLQT